MFYSNLAKLINTHSFYAFDIIDSNNAMDKYIETITKIQNEGPYVLFGYSAGGGITYRVATELIRRGYRVSDIIFLDCSNLDNYIKKDVIDEQEVDMILEIELAELVKKNDDYKKYAEIDYLRKKVKRNIINYLKLINDFLPEYKLDTNIWCVYSDNASIEYNVERWKNISNGKFNAYKGFGEHEYMLSEENLRENVMIINNILNNILD